MKGTSKALATLILEAVNIWKASYDKPGADMASYERDRQWEKDKRKARREGKATVFVHMVMVDYGQFYGLTLSQAAKQVCEKHGVPEMSEIVDYMLYCMRNDAIHWAERVLRDGSSEPGEHGDKLTLPLGVAARITQEREDKLEAEHLAEIKLEAIEIKHDSSRDELDQATRPFTKEKEDEV